MHEVEPCIPRLALAFTSQPVCADRSQPVCADRAPISRAPRNLTALIKSGDKTKKQVRVSPAGGWAPRVGGLGGWGGGARRVPPDAPARLPS